MNRLSWLLAVSLILASFAVRAEDGRSKDLRYCLELQANQDIAKCAGEISAGNKGRTFSREEVDKILSREQASAPAGTSEPSDVPPAETPAIDLLLQKEE